MMFKLKTTYSMAPNLEHAQSYVRVYVTSLNVTKYLKYVKICHLIPSYGGAKEGNDETLASGTPDLDKDRKPLMQRIKMVMSEH